MRIKFLLLGLFMASTIAHAQWTAVSTSISSNLESIVFTDALHGFTSGGFSALYKTTDGGATWTSVSGVFGGKAMSFSDNLNGYMAGVAGMSMQRTTNGGSSWTKLTPPTSNSLWGVVAINASTAIYIGTGDVVWKTADAGAHWATQELDQSANLRDISYAGSGTVYVCDNAAVYKSTDAGVSWNKVYTAGGSVSLNGLYFIDALTGYVVGSGSTILKTTDGGSTWTTQSAGVTNAVLLKVKFYDAMRGIAVGYSGMILVTSDGGATWKHSNSGSVNNLSGIALLGTSKAIIVGDAGTILVNSDIFTGIAASEVEKPVVTVFPNPFANDVYISGLDNVLNARLELHDVSGRLVKTEMLDGMETTARIKLDGLAKGLYNYRIITPSSIVAAGNIVKN